MRSLDFWISAFPAAPEGDVSGWRTVPPFRGALGSFSFLTGHVSLLGRGEIPHAPHRHPEEELIVVLSGQIAIQTAETAGGAVAESQELTRGSFVYHSSLRWHTLRNTGSGPATYFVFKWRTAAQNARDSSPTSFIFDARSLDTIHPIQSSGPLKLYRIEGMHPGGRIRSHRSVLDPGSGYAPHRDPYDVLIVLLDGCVETLHRGVEAPAAILSAASLPHGLRNSGSAPAHYLVFEFEHM
jgi:quercetin dioxygenase-like cupin family protein